MSEKIKKAIGIDLGTTNSCAAVVQNGQAKIILNDFGANTTASFVAFTDKDFVIGDIAKDQVNKDPKNSVYDAKRLIGRNFSDPIVQQDIKRWPFKVVREDLDRPAISVQHIGQEITYPPELISALVLSQMKLIATNYLGSRYVIEEVVITVPAYFNEAQRQATRQAGEMAGLNVLRIINEPTAAAIAYGLERKDDQGENTVFIFDLGGGTFDVSLLKIKKGHITVKATHGDTHLGGEDMNNILIEYCIEEFRKQSGLDITGSQKAIKRLQMSVEKAKTRLSASHETIINIDCLHCGEDFNLKLTRWKFERLCKPIFDECLEIVQTVLDEADMSKEEVDEVVLVGGSTRIPKIQAMIKAFFDGKELNKTINPDEAVAYGAAVLANQLTEEVGQEMALKLVDVTANSIGVGIRDLEGKDVDEINS